MTIVDTAQFTELRALSRLQDLPTLPAVATRLLTIADSDDPDWQTLVSVIESDPALAAKIIRLANASGAGVVPEAQTVSRAATLLGLTAVKGAALSIGVLQGMEAAGDVDDQRGLWMESLAVAAAAGELAGTTGRVNREVAFAAGLLTNIGKIAIAATAGVAYAELVARARERGVPLTRIEREVAGTDHAECAADLAERWRLPAALADLAGRDDRRGRPLGPEGDLVDLVTMARSIARHQGYVLDAAADDAHIHDATRALGFDTGTVERVCARLASAVAERAHILGLDAPDEDLYARARQRARRSLGRLFDVVDAGGRIERDASRQSVCEALSRDVTVREVLAFFAKSACEAFDLSSAVAYYRPSGSAHTHAFLCDGERRARDVSFSLACPDGDAHVLAGAVLRRLLGVGGEHANQRFTLAPMRLESPGIGGLAARGERILDDPEFASLARLEDLVEVAALAIDRTRLHDDLDVAMNRALAAQRERRRREGRMHEAEKLAALGRLAAGAAHEMNNPLAIISGRAQILRRGEFDARRRQSLDTIVDQCERLSGTIGDLLRYARPAAPRPDMVRLDDVAGRVATRMAPAFDEAGVALDVRVCDACACLLDDKQIEDALTRLLTRACRAAAERGAGGRVRLSMAPDAYGEHVVIEVSDPDAQTSRETLSRLFEPFHCVRDVDRGAGLELAIVASIIVAHGGFVRAESPPGRGTTIRAFLPLRDATGSHARRRGVVKGAASG